MNDSKPKVTAGVLCYNESKNLKPFLNLLSNQTYKNLEIVVSDNGSSDGSKEILLNIKKRYPEIKLNFFKQNRGIMQNGLKVLRMSTADYFFWVSPGDILKKNFVEECMKIHCKKKVSTVMCSIERRRFKKKKDVLDFRAIKNFNNMSAFKQANLIRTFNQQQKDYKLNFFSLGIFQKSILINIFYDRLKVKETFQDERSILYLSCLYEKMYHIKKILYIKNLDSSKTREEKYFGHKVNPNSVKLNLKSIFYLPEVHLIKKLKFSLLILKIVRYLFKKNIYDFLGSMKNKIKFN